jgi:membrane protein implicated in regulation of membrane protease activity
MATVRILGPATIIATGWLVMWGLSALIGLVFPWAAGPVFYIGGIWWTLIGLIYTWRRERFQRRLSARNKGAPTRAF